jgi:hypothetical protein
MDRFQMAADELSLLNRIKALEEELRHLKGQQIHEGLFGAPMKWIEVHSNQMGGYFLVKERFPLYQTPKVVARASGMDVAVIHHREPDRVEQIHLTALKARKAYEAFRGEGAQPLHVAWGVAAHAPWTPELETMLRAI